MIASATLGPDGLAADPGRVDESMPAALIRARADLARGDGLAAMEGFERLAASGHSVEAELGLVRAYVQAGQYRRALGFAAHVAGEHGDEPAAGLLYAWLLRVGGQAEVAARVLDEASARAPADNALLAARRAFAAPLPVPTGVLLESPYRMAPVAAALADPIPPQARVVANGVLVDGGRHALVASSAVAMSPPRIWLRNGLGQTREAEIDLAASAAMPQGVVLLRLLVPVAVEVTLADRDPFAGSPGYVLEYGERSPPSPSWPQLRQGFLGGADADGRRRLGIEIASRGGGSPVLDASGRLAGVVLADNEGRSSFLPVSKWPRQVTLGHERAPAASMSAASLPSIEPRNRLPPAPDRAYEQGLAIALQVIALP